MLWLLLCFFGGVINGSYQDRIRMYPVDNTIDAMVGLVNAYMDKLDAIDNQIDILDALINDDDSMMSNVLRERRLYWLSVKYALYDMMADMHDLCLWVDHERFELYALEAMHYYNSKS